MNHIAFRVFFVTLFQSESQLDLKLDVFNPKNLFHVFFVHIQQHLSSHLFGFEYFNEILESFLLGKFNDIFSRPALSQLLDLLICNEVILPQESSLSSYQ